MMWNIALVVGYVLMIVLALALCRAAARGDN